MEYICIGSSWNVTSANPVNNCFNSRERVIIKIYANLSGNASVPHFETDYINIIDYIYIYKIYDDADIIHINLIIISLDLNMHNFRKYNLDIYIDVKRSIYIYMNFRDIFK